MPTKLQQPNDIKFFIPFTKKDDKERMVYGYASTETLDSQGEVVKIDAIKAALPDYMKFANIREMHQPSAVGKTKEATVDSKGLYIGVKVVDDNAWKKVEAEVYNGFSIGGSVVEKIDTEIQSIILKEISLVDRPANPDAVFDIVKNEDGINEDKTEEENKAEDQSPADDGGDDSNDDADEPKGETADEGADKSEDGDKPDDSAGAVTTEDEAKETADASADLKKSIWTADKIVYLATCLADIISYYNVSGKNVEKLTEAFTSLKAAAAIELNEKDEFYVPNEDIIEDVYEVVEAADKVLDLHKADLEAAQAAKKEATLNKAQLADLNMPTEDQISEALTKQGLPVNVENISMVKLAHADVILNKIKHQQEAGLEVDVAKTNLEKELTDLLKGLTERFQAAPELDPFVHYEIKKADVQDVKEETEPQPAVQVQEVKEQTAETAPETAPETTPEKPAAEGKSIKKSDEPEEFVKMAKADLEKLEDRLAKAEEAITKVAKLEERIVELENSEKPTTARGAMTVERFGKTDEVATDQKELLGKIDALNKKLLANPHDAALRDEADQLHKEYLVSKHSN